MVRLRVVVFSLSVLLIIVALPLPFLLRYRTQTERLARDCTKLRQAELGANENVRLYQDKLHQNQLNNSTRLSETYRTDQSLCSRTFDKPF